MLVTTTLLILLVVATVTDVRERKIYNWTTYPGVLAALAANAVASGVSWLGFDVTSNGGTAFWLGLVGFPDSALGFLACGAVMVICYVFFPGGIGGGDIKLIAVIGAFLGVMRGLEAMLWTIVLAACFALTLLVWRYGAVRLLAQSVQYMWLLIRFRTPTPVSDEERKPLKTHLYLAPSALLAVVIVVLFSQ